jgi:nicotinamidase-related amidase
MTNILPHTDGGLITADNSAVVFIDHQPQMTFGVANTERQQLVNNLVMLAKGAKELSVVTSGRN